MKFHKIFTYYYEQGYATGHMQVYSWRKSKLRNIILLKFVANIEIDLILMYYRKKKVRINLVTGLIQYFSCSHTMQNLNYY